MQSRMIAVSLGTAIIAWLPTLFLPFSIAICGIVITSSLLIFTARYRPVLIWLLLLCIGAMYGCWFGFQLLDQKLTIDDEDVEHHITGHISGLPEIKHRYGQRVLRFTFEVLSSSSPSRIKTLLLSWPEGPELIPGQRWQLTIKARQPRGLSNPVGFDYQQWLVQKGIDAKGKVVASANNYLLGEKWISFDRWRWQFSKQLDQYESSITHLNLIKALLIADKRFVSPTQWQVYANTGTIHLLIISGLHIGIVALFGFYLGRFIAVFFWPTQIQTIASIFAICFAVLYAAAAGFSLPTQRALIMVLVLMAGLLLQRNISILTRFIAALLLCLAIDPLAVISPSFWLSFVAVAVILFTCSARKNSTSSQLKFYKKPWLRAQLAVFIGLTPLLLAQFQQAPMLAVLINLIALPLFSFVLIPLLLIFTLSLLIQHHELSLIFLTAADYLLELFHRLVIEIHTYSDVMSIGPKPLISWLFIGVACVLLLLPRHIPGRYLATALLLPFIFMKDENIDPETMQITVFDVGQGLSVFITVDDKALVYDVGASWPQGSMVESVLLPYFRAQGISTLDAVVISHNDNDHAGGIKSLIQNMHVSTLYTGELIVEPNIKQVRCDDQQWSWGQVSFEFIPVNNRQQYEGNNRSCILRLSYRHNESSTSILLTGDIERDIEQALIEQHPQLLASTILFAPHHGSLSSSSWPFIKRVNPNRVIYSTGYKNMFNHPHPSVVSRYEVLGSKPYNTATDGALEIKLRPNGAVTAQGLRWHKRYYWQ